MAIGGSVKARLDKANVTLAQELFLIKSNLDTYSLIGLNASRIPSAKLFFGHLQQLSLVSVVPSKKSSVAINLHSAA